jgi:hypothetical protein
MVTAEIAATGPPSTHIIVSGDGSTLPLPPTAIADDATEFLPPLQLPSTESRQVKCLSPPLITGNLSPGPRLLVLPKTHRRLSLWNQTALLPRLLLRRSVRLGNRYHNEFLYSDVLLIFKIMYLYIYRCHSFWFAIIHCRKHRPKSRVILRNSARNTASSSHSKARSTKSNFYI